MSKDKHGRYRGIYCGRFEFWLSTCQGDELLERIRCSWTDGGSKKLIRDHFCGFNCDWYNVDNLCDNLGFQIANPLLFPSLTTAFLGAGGQSHCRY